MTPEELETVLTEEIGNIALAVAKRVIPSNALIRAIKVERLGSNTVRLTMPHYWAIYIHDGHGVLYPRKGTYLAWFRDPLDDPRLFAGEGPERLSQVRYLRQVWDRALFKQALTSRKLILAKAAHGTLPGTQFFTKPPMSTLSENDEVRAAVINRVADFVQFEIGEALPRSVNVVLPL